MSFSRPFNLGLSLVLTRELDRHRLSTGGSEKIQMSALLGAVKIAMQLSQNKA